jgi:hypothetical protein
MAQPTYILWFMRLGEGLQTFVPRFGPGLRPQIFKCLHLLCHFAANFSQPPGCFALWN